MGEDIKAEYKDVFEPINHVDDLPTEVTCSIKLKNADKQIASRSYSCPRKYRQAWKDLIDQHLQAGRIRPSSSPYSSPAFLIPKPDSTVLPRWVNDFRELNANTVVDRHPLPRVDDILTDAARGKYWSKLDMTDAFFHTRLDEASIPLTAVNTPFGLYEWTVMPQGLKNSPPVHQRRVNAALRKFLGEFCHIYLDDIIIWSETLEDHVKHVRLIMDTLQKHCLSCNPKKSKFFLLQVDFLGHRILRNGIAACERKAEKILSWPTPKSAGDVKSFLGLVRYLASFLPRLADYTRILSPLTADTAHAEWPPWTTEHQLAFDGIKELVSSRECLTVIDHVTSGDNKIFVTTDASDFCTGAVLSWGPTWETARPVAFDSVPLTGAQLNYPVHEKELLAIIRALNKWRSDLLGSNFTVFTDHRTLENFDRQRDLSHRQVRWMELMSQYDFTINYIRSEDNTVADALSRLPVDPASDPVPDVDPEEQQQPLWSSWMQTSSVNSVLHISAKAAHRP